MKIPKQAYTAEFKYQVLFLELKERFIARKARHQDGEFDLKGYYFKTDRFKLADVVSVEEVVADSRWFSKRTGTMLTRIPSCATTSASRPRSRMDGCSSSPARCSRWAALRPCASCSKLEKQKPGQPA